MKTPIKKRLASPARSQGAGPRTPIRHRHRRAVSVSSARSNASGRLTALIQNRNMDSFTVSPLASRKSILSDNTEIEEPRRKSWWKNLGENSRDVTELLQENRNSEPNNIIEELDIEVLSQEKRNYTMDLPESSDSESINSIIIPDRKLFKQKENAPQKNFGQIIGTRETLAKLHKTNNTNVDKSINVVTRELFQHNKKSKPIFPAALLNISPNKTAADKTKEFAAVEPKAQVRNIFGKRGTKRKNIFTNFIVSESEDEIPEIQPKVFGFQKKIEARRRASSSSRGIREPSPTSSITTDIEMDDWKILPSSTMIEHQLEVMMADGNSPKRTRLSKLTEIESKASSDTTSKGVAEENYEQINDDEQNNEKQGNDIANKLKILMHNQREEKTHDKSRENNNQQVCKESETNKQVEEYNENLVQNNDECNIHNESGDKRGKEQEASDIEVAVEYKNKNQEVVVNNSEKEKQNSTEIKLQNQVVEDEYGVKNKEQNISQDEEVENENEEEEQNISQEGEVENEDEEQNISQNAEVENEDEDEEQDISQEAEVENEDEDEEQNSSQEAEVENEDEDEEQHISQEAEEDDEEQNISQEAEVENDDEDEEQNMSQEAEVENEDEDEAQNMSQEAEVENEDEDAEQHISQEAEEENEDEDEAQDISQEAEVENEDEEGEQNVSQEAEVENEDEEEEQNISQESQVENENEQEQQNLSQEVDEIEEDEGQNLRQKEVDNKQMTSQDEGDVEGDIEQDLSDEEDEDDVHKIRLVLDENEEEEEEEHDMSQENHEQNSQEENHIADDDDEDDEPNISQQDDNKENDNEGAEMSEASAVSDDDAEHDKQEISNNSYNNDQEIIESTDEIETPNVSHDTTGRNRKKNLSPEVILHDSKDHLDSFAVRGRNTSVRKTEMIKTMNLRPSLAPVRESTGFSDGTRNSSAEGSGWDSHRTTRKTLRQTFGRDFTPRKSLRALVMEKSAKRQTQHNDLASVTAKFPQANSTELPETSNRFEDDQYENQEPNHEVSLRTRQTTLERYLEEIKQKNTEARLKLEEAIRNSLTAPSKEHVFKVPAKPLFARRQTKPTKVVNKPKQTKSTLFLGELPTEVIEDLKYKPPKRFQPSNAPWITKRLYKFLESKLEAKYDYKARIRAEKLVEHIYHFAKDLRRHDVASSDAVDVLKREMARLEVVKTHFEFYEFFHQFMPREVRVKVVPDVVNKISLPRHGVFSDIL